MSRKSYAETLSPMIPQYGKSYQGHSCVFILIRIIAFDIPSVDMQNIAFEDRYKFMLANVISDHPFIESKTTLNR